MISLGLYAALLPPLGAADGEKVVQREDVAITVKKPAGEIDKIQDSVIEWVSAVLGTGPAFP